MFDIRKSLLENIRDSRVLVAIPEKYSPAPLHPYFAAYDEVPVFDPSEHEESHSMLSPWQIVEALSAGAWVRFHNTDDLTFVKAMLVEMRNFLSSNMPRGGDENAKVRQCRMVIEDLSSALLVLEECSSRMEIIQRGGDIRNEQPPSLFDIVKEISS